MDLMVLGVATAAPPLPFVAIITTLFVHIDPFYFIYGDLLGNPGFKNTSALFKTILWILRAFPCLCGFECARTISLAVMLLFVIVDILRKQFHNMFVSKIPDLSALRHMLLKFMHLTIICINIKSNLQEGLTLAITASFWATVLGAWMILNTYHSIPLFLYMFVCVSMVIVALGVFIGLTVLSKFCEHSECLTLKLKGKAKKLYANCKTISMRKELLVMKKNMRALVTIKIYYYPFLVIDAQFCRDTASNLVDKILDSVLIF